MTERVCFRLQVKPERMAEYVERHRAVWPEMLRALERSGRRNYSLFLDRDGLLIGYFEVDSADELAASQRRLADDPATVRWEAEAAEFFVALDGRRADQGAVLLPEVFNLERQLAVITTTNSEPEARG